MVPVGSLNIGSYRLLFLSFLLLSTFSDDNRGRLPVFLEVM